MVYLIFTYSNNTYLAILTFKLDHLYPVYLHLNTYLVILTFKLGGPF